jgi:ribosomal protein S18 acetylase RimI-like enzyme
VIRPALPGDARAIAEVHVQSWQSAYRDLLPQAFLDALSVEKRQAMWAESLAKKKPSLLVAEVDERIVGFSAFGPCRDEGALPTDHEVWAIYVVPSQWSTGLGQQLWLQAKEAMARQGATRISLWVLAGNQRAIRFYVAAGFRPEPGLVKSFEMAGVRFQERRYLLQEAAGPAITLHPATLNDAEFAYQVLERAMREYAMATWGSWPEAKVRARASEDAAAGRSQLIRLGATAVGVVRIDRLPTHFELDQLYILPEHQGRGIGRHVLQGLLAEASAACLPVRLRVLRVNPARRLYERHGFTITSESPERFYMERLP